MSKIGLLILVLFFSNIIFVGAQSNDYCQNAITLIPNTNCNYISGSTIDATESQPVPTSGWCSYIYSTSANDVWYKFTATCSSHHIQVQGASDFAPVVEIEDAACGNMIVCDDAGIGGLVDISVSCTIGNTYYIRVFNDYGSSIWATGTYFQICVTPSCSTNDDCNFATTLISGINCNYISGSTINATESQPPVHCATVDPYSAYDIWYKFTAVNSHHIIKVLGDSDFEPIVEVEDAACGSYIACADGISSGTLVTINLINLTIGNAYYIRVYDFNGYGHFQICVTHLGNSGIEDINSFANWNIYPNPANDYITIENTSLNNYKDEVISIYNIQDQLLLQQPLLQAKTNIDISSFIKGMYVVKVKTEKGVVIKKFVKE